jgi:hypothetical protein
MLRKILPLFLLLPIFVSASGCGILGAGVAVLTTPLVLPAVCYKITRNETGHGGFFPSESRFYRAMEVGDGKNAIYWANRMIYYEHQPHYDRWTDKVLHRNPVMADGQYCNPVTGTCHFTGEYHLACACEMNGELEKALKLFQGSAQNHHHKSHYDKDCRFDQARIFYKLNRKKESFETYSFACQNLLAEWERFGRRFSLTDSLLDVIFPVSFYRNENIEIRRRFCNFADIHEFYLFMNEEYEKQNRPEKYAEVMKRLREIDQRRDEIMKEYRREPAPVTTNTR